MVRAHVRAREGPPSGATLGDRTNGGRPMADDDTGAEAGTVLGFPRVTLPGAVGDDPPPAADPIPALVPLSTPLAPPALLSLAAAPDIAAATQDDAGNHQPGITDDSGSSAH